MKRVLAALLYAGAFVALGLVVSGHPPSAFDRGELGTYGLDVAFAKVGRAAGQFPPYAVLCALALGFGLVRRAYLGAALWLIALMLVIWKTSDACKDLFHRARPESWLVVHETSASYPSGHAVLSLAFYGFVAFIVARSALPSGVRAAVVALCALWILGIGWSRLALGAHFPTDVLGGYLLGAAGLCCATLAYDRTRGREVERVARPTRSRYTR